MKNFAHWGWTLALLGALFIISAARTTYYLFTYSMDMEIFFIVRYHIIPIFMDIGVAGLTGLLAWLIAKHRFKQPDEAFLFTFNCIILFKVLIGITYPLLDAFFALAKELNNLGVFLY
jgi:hypothetical protein